MKKIFLILAVSFLTITNSNAQKFAYVDTDYILNKIPEFRQAQDKLDAFSADWQKEIENKKEEAIFKKGDEVIKLQQKYFGQEGDLYVKRQELIRPIQDKIHDAIQQLAANNKYQVIFDSSSDLIMLYKNDNLDKSDKVLELMGY